MPVIVYDVIRYCRRKCDTIEPLVDFFIKYLNVCTALYLSASPLEAGWYGADVIWRIPFCKTLEFVTCKYSAIVSYKHFWKSVSGKNRTQLFYHNSRCSIGDCLNLHPLRMCVNQDEELAT